MTAWKDDGDGDTRSFAVAVEGASACMDTMVLRRLLAVLAVRDLTDGGCVCEGEGEGEVLEWSGAVG